MSVICPTVLADTIDDYREQMAVIEPFARRIQIDLGDGHFTTKSVEVSEVWWPKTIAADIHLMHDDPSGVLPALVALKPHMIILHAEARGDIGEAMAYLQQHNIRAGIALLQGTNPDDVQGLIEQSDHVLIFSGSLGSFGGTADLSLLSKVPKIRAIKSGVEIGWDGGAHADNARQLSDGGIDVINVGGAIQKANQPENAYRDILRHVL